jgi:hypothetical protein
MKTNLKIVSLVVLTMIIITSCSTNEVPNQNSTSENSTSEFSYKGSFVSSAHPTSGIAKISKDKTQLLLEGFKTDNGPDLNIYLASSLSTIKTDYIDLGDLKGLNGNYSYSATNATDFSKYKYVVVWCVDFNVNFGYAVLAP